MPATTTLLEYLREHLGRTGTKEGCAEGDCGACTVLLGELSGEAGAIHYCAVNSCIRFLPTIDGKEVVTVESLQAADGTLHPVQQAMVDKHASQCGFCTPGFVMSLLALYLSNPAPRRTEILATLSGNLCRCTGYRPIIEAAACMGQYPIPARWSAQDAQSAERRSLLAGLRRQQTLELPGFLAPRTVEELAAALEREPDAVLLAGGTDLALSVTKQLRELPSIIYLGEIAELDRIERSATGLTIGAAVTLTRAWRALVQSYPALDELAQRFASPPVCNSGTLCGNIANGSPIGDSMPALIALGARLQLRRGARTRQLALEDFYLGYQRRDLQPGEFVEHVSIPTPPAGALLASYKVSKRFDQDISGISAGFLVRLEQGVVCEARLAYGAMAAVPGRARAAEASLIGQRWDERAIEAAAAALARDYQPLSDLRGSSAYRLRTAAALLRRFLLQTRASPGALRLSDCEAEPSWS